MHIAALVEGPNHVCCRYRVAAFRAAFEKAGHSLTLIPYPRRPWGWFGLTRQLANVDIVIIQRKLLASWQLYLLKRQGRRVVFDYDDAVFLRDSYHRHGVHSSSRLRRFAHVVRNVDAVTAGNDFLREQAVPFIPADRAVVIPTCVEPDSYPVADHANSDVAELVWIGSSSTLKGLEAICPLLEEVGCRVPGVCLKLVCDRFLKLKHLPVRAVPWSEAGEAAALASADIGISWLPDDDWSRGKCGLKVLQYMAAGLPVVANRVGVQSTMIRHGETGYLASNADEWVRAITLLVRDRDRRRRMGQMARRYVQTMYSVASGAQSWLSLLERLEPARRQSA
ncbi:MAG: glycosyltransferase family 4 protein [Gemmataceae bacterium]